MLLEVCAGLLDDDDPETAIRREVLEETGVAERGGVAEEGEEVEPVELPVAEALEMMRRGKILDAKAIMLLRWLEASPPRSLFVPAYRGQLH